MAANAEDTERERELMGAEEMSNWARFAPLFMLLPAEEAARALVVLAPQERLALLRACRKGAENLIPPLVSAAGLPSLQVLQDGTGKLGEVLIALAEVAGERLVEGLLTEWAQEEPEVWQALRGRVFFFDEVVLLPDRVVEEALREVKLTPLLLQGTAPTAQEKLLRNVSQRVAKDVSEQIRGVVPTAVTQEAAYRSKAEFCRLILRWQATGIFTIAFPLPESMVDAYRRTCQAVAAAVVRMDSKERYLFLRENCDVLVLRGLFAAPEGVELQAALLPLCAEPLQQELTREAGNSPPLTGELIQAMGRCWDKISGEGGAAGSDAGPVFVRPPR